MRILLAESEPVTRALLTGALTRWGHTVDVVDDLVTTWAALSHPTAPRLAIVAPRLEDGDTAPLLDKLRQTPLARRPWILARQGPSGNTLTPLNADDILPMPFELNCLRARVQVGEHAQSIADELAHVRASLAQHARLDPLTGIASRATVLDALDRELARSKRCSGDVSIIVADLDGLRRVNATFGAAAGDAALAETALRLVADVRQYDIVGRSGSKEFLVVLPGCDHGGATRLAGRLRESIRSRALSTHEGIVALTASFGVATVTSDFAADALLQCASTGLAKAKEQGGDRVCSG